MSSPEGLVPAGSDKVEKKFTSKLDDLRARSAERTTKRYNKRKKRSSEPESEGDGEGEEKENEGESESEENENKSNEEPSSLDELERVSRIKIGSIDDENVDEE